MELTADIEVSWSGGFTKYDLKAGNGNIEITQTSYQYDGVQLKNMGTESYNVDSWDYTEEGYLMFSGTWFSEVLYAYMVSDAEEYKAFRVQPLDEKYRELNRQYVLTIGYENNNMFIVDWSEDDYGELVVRPLEDGGVQYVSNKIISAEDNAEETWHTPRLSMEEWKKMYGDG
ncbi:DUF6070 family protein [Enterocloster sp. OA13]|uniref:DUF6070 family protein n=1 Tax=Enterocloster sp. OA13 TaxID=2914161 RepID=UPI00046FC487|nr:DUF6070 family protein [Enterocloster sp. OA13]